MGFDKNSVKSLISINNIFDILEEYGGEPEFNGETTIISRTICHNPLGEGSRKLYYYHNDGKGLFRCYTGCAEPSFDIFELIIKIANIQFHQEWDLDKAVRFLTYKLGLEVPEEEEQEEYLLKEDFAYFEEFDRIKEIDLKTYKADFKIYDDTILSRFNYNVKLTPWLDEGITEEALKNFNIGFYPGLDVITIPHYDIKGDFIGLRGRALCKAEAAKYGKYRPIKIKNTLYTHPLGYNLYGLNHNKDPIKQMEKAIVFEGKKKVSPQSTFPLPAGL